MSNRYKALITTFIFLVFSTHVFARTINKIKARDITGKFLKLRAKPLNTDLGDTIKSIQPVYDSNSVILYYAVYLEPAGIVFTSPDDEIEPIIAFSASSDFDPYADKPLAVLLRNDMAKRLKAIEQMRISNDEKIKEHNNKVKGKWIKIDIADRVMDSSVGINLSSIDDVRVEPFVLSKWDQGSKCGEYCYNYYTPNHYVAGCVATAFAQVLRYFQYPTFGVGTPTFQIHIDGDPYDYSLRGGNGAGGLYDWANMELDPDCYTTEPEHQAIGALLYDCGVSVHMSYTETASSAGTGTASERLVDTFGFDNSIYGSESNIPTADLIEMINPNLDAGLPVMLSVSRPGGGHAILSDGYGYDMGTLYHHLNMGWGGSYNAWYNLPNIPAYYTYDTVRGCVYNIFINGTGEIISGRVTSGDFPVAGATITATAAGAGPFVTTTNDKGIYALTNVNSNKLYTVTASYSGMGFLPQTASVGHSTDWLINTGNVWGVDFVNTVPSPPVASDGFAQTDQDTPAVITLEAVDESLPNPPGALTYIIQSLPVHGKLADADTGTPINYVPYELASDQVIYTPCIYYHGGDLFTFAADDGGTPPNGGLSNIATITMDVGPVTTVETLLETDFTSGIPGGWVVVDGYSDGETWRTDNPGGRTSSYWSGTFCIVDSDWAGHVNMDEGLITPVIDCSYCSDVTLKFSHYFSTYQTEICDVDVSVNYGPWQNVLRYTGASTGGNITEDISSLADGQSNVRIRWRYYNANYEWYWGIDNVEITGSVSTQPMAGDFDVNCCVDNLDLEMLINDWLTESGQPGWDETCNLYDDNIINAADFALFALNWLEIQE